MNILRDVGLVLTMSFTAAMLISCGSQTVKEVGKPEWIFGKSKQYPHKQYLQGVGEADTMADAKSRARAEIAKVFNVTVLSQSADSSSFEFSGDGQLSLKKESQSVARELQTKTSQLLEGVELPEAWKDEVNQRYYALAVLSRLKTAAALRSEITQLDNATRLQIQNARQANSLFRKIRESRKTLTLQMRRNNLNKQLQIISAVGNFGGVESSWSVESLAADHAELLSRVSITPSARGAHREDLQTSLANSLATQGFNVVENGEYHIDLELSSTPLVPQNNWHYRKATLIVSIKGEDKVSLGGKEWNFKVSSTEPALTEIRVMEKAKAIVRDQLSDRIFDILEESK